MIEAQRKVSVRGAVADGFIIPRVQLIKVLSVRDSGEGGEWFSKKLLRQSFQTAFLQPAERVVVFQTHLRRTDRVVHGSPDHNAHRIRHRGFKGDVVSHLCDGCIREECRKVPDKGVSIDIPTCLMRHRHIHARSFLHGKADADDMRLRRIEGRLCFLTVPLIGGGFKVKRHHLCSGKIGPQLLERCDQTIVFHMYILSGTVS